MNDDLISRQAAIDYCYQLINVEHQQGSDEMNYGQERVNQTETILHHLELMPSAQPEIVRCKDCIYWWESHKMCERNKDKNHNCACMDCDANFYCKNAERREE